MSFACGLWRYWHSMKSCFFTPCWNFNRLKVLTSIHYQSPVQASISSIRRDLALSSLVDQRICLSNTDEKWMYTCRPPPTQWNTKLLRCWATHFYRIQILWAMAHILQDIGHRSLKSQILSFDQQTLLWAKFLAQCLIIALKTNWTTAMPSTIRTPRPRKCLLAVISQFLSSRSLHNVWRPISLPLPKTQTLKPKVALKCKRLFFVLTRANCR